MYIRRSWFFVLFDSYLSASYHKLQEWNTDNSWNILRLQHINVAFNCCLDGIVENVEIDGDIIRIEATGILSSGQGCWCDCLYDLDYEIKNLEPIVYLLIIPSITNSMKIDLRKSGSNKYCENRTGYPWN